MTWESGTIVSLTNCLHGHDLRNVGNCISISVYHAVMLMLQILVEQSLMTAVGLEWTGIQGTGPLPAAPASHLALRNHALLMHRAEVDTAAAELTCSTTSLSGQHAQTQTQCHHCTKDQVNAASCMGQV